MDLDPAAEEEERQLEDHNEAEDAGRFMGFGDTHGDPIELDGVPISDHGTSTGSTVPPPGSSAAGAAPRSRKKRSKCWNDFDELTNVVNGKTVRYGVVCKYCKSNLSAKSGSAWTELCRLIARDDLPLWHGSTDAFQDYINRAHNPRFVHVSRQTTARDMVKLYNDCKKRLLGLRLIDGKHSGINIANLVASVVDDYDLTHKVFAITLDNASSNNIAMKYLRPFLFGYLGVPAPVVPETPNDDDTHSDDDLSAMFLHQCCCCHIINLGVKAGLDPLKTYIDDIRTAITFLNDSNQRYCMSMVVRPHKFGVDMDVRWNSTYLMLKHLVPYKSTFSVFIKTQYPLNRDVTFLLTDNHWIVAEKILSFLELFYESTVALPGVYYPTAPLMLHHILRIARHLNAYENDLLLRCVVVSMKDKFLKYWREIPILYAVAFILDPRPKMRGFNRLLVRLSSLFGTDYSRFPINVRSLICMNQNLVTHASVSLINPAHGSKKNGLGGIYDDDDIGVFPSTPLRRTPGSTSLSSQTLSTVASTSELASYLDHDILTEFDEDFNILFWWQKHELTYPILSLLAKDVLTVPASTISSESNFSLASRVIKERRYRLTPDMVEVLSCIKDCEHADTHLQHSVEEETNKLEEVHENMYLDVDDAAKDER
ncbi:LOW QUALITY PROTEIN: hypothetical protein U9M48_044333 [Paspalum notatum var. saurae]|uniref:Transposase n=1 Tax=Paspalum notatum var. saurae TaxID=547442 RepID=A0AAQ3UWT8_PASNO